jgi:hypothetical protein
MYSLDLPQFSIHSWGSAIHPGLGNRFRRCERFRNIFFPVPEFIEFIDSRKQAQNARFHLIENERFGWFSRKQGL